ncbi:unnamed protein product [Parajaminaea phylloscopi]
MGSDAYSTFKPGGSLKFKGGESVGSSSKKKRKSKDKKAKSSSYPASSSSGLGKATDGDRNDRTSLRQIGDDDEAALQDEELMERTPSGSGKAANKMTDAERRFAEVQRRRMSDKIRKEATKSHKERVGEFNKYLENLTEHYDLPKVGPG